MLLHRRRLAGLSCVFAALACAWLNPLPASAESFSFYDVSSEALSGPPGSIIRTETFAGAPWGTRAARVLYRSTGLGGEPIAVSAVVVVPTKRAAGGGTDDRRLGAPDHRRCAQMRALAAARSGHADDHRTRPRWSPRAMWSSPRTIRASARTASHPYLVGVSEGRAVLDSVRAARTLTHAGNRFAVWGHSQGGHAALWTAELARTYAPELDLVGVATAAPASELAALLDDDLTTTAGQVLTALSLWSWSHVFGTRSDLGGAAACHQSRWARSAGNAFPASPISWSMPPPSSRSRRASSRAIPPRSRRGAPISTESTPGKSCGQMAAGLHRPGQRRHDRRSAGDHRLRHQAVQSGRRRPLFLGSRRDPRRHRHGQREDMRSTGSPTASPTKLAPTDCIAKNGASH